MPHLELYSIWRIRLLFAELLTMAMTVYIQDTVFGIHLKLDVSVLVQTFSRISPIYVGTKGITVLLHLTRVSK